MLAVRSMAADTMLFCCQSRQDRSEDTEFSDQTQLESIRGPSMTPHLDSRLSFRASSPPNDYLQIIFDPESQTRNSYSVEVCR